MITVLGIGLYFLLLTLVYIIHAWQQFQGEGGFGGGEGGNVADFKFCISLKVKVTEEGGNISLQLHEISVKVIHSTVTIGFSL